MHSNSTERASRSSRPIRILDLSTVLAGPFATLFLADAGFDVVKVESPDGDITRTVGHAPASGMGSIFQHINRNKRSIALDLKHPAGHAALKRLIASSDVFVHNMRPQAISRLGLGYESVRSCNPQIVYCSFLGFGSSGPYAGRPAYDDLIQGLAGVADLEARTRNGTPAYVPMSMADRIVGLYGASAIQSALLRRMTTGEGAAIEVPMFESLAHFVLVEHMFYRSFEPALGEAVNPRNVDPNRRPLQTKDGYICVLPYTNEQWRRLFDILGRPDMRDDPRFATFTGRLDNIGELYTFLSDQMARKTTSDWLAALSAADIPASRMNTIEDLLTDPHLAAVGFYRLLPDESGGSFRHMTSTVRSDEVSPQIRRAPRLGEHSRALLREVGFDSTEIDQMISAGVVIETAAA